MSSIVRQAKIVDTQSEFHEKVVDIFIENGFIKAIDLKLDIAADEVIAANGCFVTPGFVDVFADYREPGFEHKETIVSGLKAAASGGFTDVFLAPNTNPVVSTKSIVEFVQQKAKGNIVALYPLGAITQDIEGKSLAEMMDMSQHGAIAFTDGWKPVQNANLFLKALEYVKSKTNSTSNFGTIETVDFHKIVQTKNMVLDISKIKNLGYTPKYNLNQMLDTLI